MSYIIDCYNKNELCEKCLNNAVCFIYIEDDSKEKIRKFCTSCMKEFIKDNKENIKDTV